MQCNSIKLFILCIILDALFEPFDESMRMLALRQKILKPILHPLMDQDQKTLQRQ